MTTDIEIPQILEAYAGESVMLIIADSQLESTLSQALLAAAYEVIFVKDKEDALKQLKTTKVDFIVSELPKSKKDALNFIDEILLRNPRSVVIALSTTADPQFAIEVIKHGAHEIVELPCQGEDLLVACKTVRERERSQLAKESDRAQASKRYSFSNIIANSPAMKDIFENVRKVADYRTTVLLQGESGTGKELIARAIHHNSNRKSKAFIAINCGAIPENLLESELFGHKRGSFTDATRDKLGLFQEANGGTILLDEIGELPVHLQVKLLRVLQENEIRPVGEAESIPIDVRIIAATLRDLEEDILEGRFRDDLYYRLNVLTLNIPALRERRDDIPLLVQHFIKENNESLGLPIYGIADDAMDLLVKHQWPGNIRELENCIERAMILTEKDVITLESLPRSVRESDSDTSIVELPDDELSIKRHSRRLEETLIKRALEKTDGNRTHAAKLLEISHRTLLYKLKEYEL
jgi:two-component system response regulator AtoC